jgi:preprotein translocase subunit YajC
MELTVTKTIKVQPILSLDDLITGQDVFTKSGIQGTITYLSTDKMIVYFPSKDKSLEFVDDGMANLLWGIFIEVPDYEKIYNNAAMAQPCELGVDSLLSLKVKDEVSLGGYAHGVVTKVTEDSVHIKSVLPDGSVGTIAFKSDIAPGILEQIRVVKLH